MKVEDGRLTGGAAGVGGSAGVQETVRAGRGGTGRKGALGSGDSDRVEFSSLASGLSRALAEDGHTHAGRVQSLAALYQGGRYQPDSQATAGQMVSESLEARQSAG